MLQREKNIVPGEPRGAIPSPLVLPNARLIGTNPMPQEAAKATGNPTVQDKIREKIINLAAQKERLAPESPAYKVNAYFLKQYTFILNDWENKTADLHQCGYDYLNCLSKTYQIAALLNNKLISVILALSLEQINSELSTPNTAKDQDIIDILSARIKMMQLNTPDDKPQRYLNTFLSQLDCTISFLGSRNSAFIVELIKHDAELTKTCFADNLAQFMSETIERNYIRYIFDEHLDGGLPAANKYLMGILQGFDKNQERYVIALTNTHQLLIEPKNQKLKVEPDDEQGKYAELTIASNQIHQIIPLTAPKKFGHFFRKKSENICEVMRARLEEYTIKFNESDWQIETFVRFIIPDNTASKPTLSYFLALLAQGLDFMERQDCAPIKSNDIYADLSDNPAIFSDKFTLEEQTMLRTLVVNYLKGLQTPERACHYKLGNFEILKGDNQLRIDLYAQNINM